jgi:DNA (cytosine-5)-methyltransferase 1
MNRELKAISLFSGAGGMDIGVQQAGFDIIASIENDPYCCETLRSNIDRHGRNTKVIEADIRQINPKSLMTGISRKEIDLLFGGPPCQPFSQIGKQKGLEDERGLLLFQIVRFAQFLKPKAILIEQVRGLINAKDMNGERGGILKRLLTDLEKLGYLPKWKLLNAADYGIPQLRKRVFIVATKPSNRFQFPVPTHCEQQSPLFALSPYVKVGDVIQGLDKPSPKIEV